MRLSSRIDSKLEEAAIRASKGDEGERVRVRTDLARSFPHLSHLIPVPPKLGVKLPNLHFDSSYTSISLYKEEEGSRISKAEEGKGGKERLTEAMASVRVGLGVALLFPKRRFIDELKEGEADKTGGGDELMWIGRLGRG